MPTLPVVDEVWLPELDGAEPLIRGLGASGAFAEPRVHRR